MNVKIGLSVAIGGTCTDRCRQTDRNELTSAKFPATFPFKSVPLELSQNYTLKFILCDGAQGAKGPASFNMKIAPIDERLVAHFEMKSFANEHRIRMVIIRGIFSANNFGNYFSWRAFRRFSPEDV